MMLQEIRGCSFFRLLPYLNFLHIEEYKYITLAEIGK